MKAQWVGYSFIVLIVVLSAELAGYLYFDVRGKSLSGYRPGWLMQSREAQPISDLDQPHLQWRTEYLPWGAWHVPNASTPHRLSCFDVEYRSNSAGARDRERDRTGAGRILFLGDSVVEGYGVDEEFRITNRLETLLNTEVLNFSSSEHFGPLNLELLYEGLASDWQHDHLIIGLLPANDFHDNDSEVWANKYDTDKSRYRPYYSADGGVMYVTAKPDDGATMKQLVEANGSMARAKAAQINERRMRRENRGVLQHGIDVIKYLSWTPGFVYEIQKLRQLKQSYSGYRDFTEVQLRNVLGSLTRMVEKATTNGIRVSLVVFPYPADYSLGPDDNRLTPRLEQWADEQKIDMLDLLPEFKDQPSMTHTCDSHWSNEGNRFAADAIARWLSRS